MANAFQDQLLKAGLVSKDKLSRSNKAKHKQAKQQSKKNTSESDEIKRLAKQAAQEKAERDRELNRLKVEENNKKAIVGQIKQLIEMNRININSDSELAYHFVDAGKVKQIYVTEELRRKILSGQLSIVKLDGKYSLIPSVVAQKILQRDASHVILCNEAGQTNDEVDEYADYKVPDDLMW